MGFPYKAGERALWNRAAYNESEKVVEKGRFTRHLFQSTEIRNTGFRTGIPGRAGERGFCGRAAVLRLDGDLDDSVGV